VLRNLLLLLAFLGLFFLGFNRVAAYEDTISRSTFTISGAIPVPVLEMRPASGETSLVVVVAHGFSGSKELMASFGVELARAGVTTYLFDFPGHGESPVVLAGGNFTDQDAQENITTVGEVVDYVRQHNSATTHPNIILLGHSMGSAAVGDYSMQHATDSDIISTVLVSPVGMENPTRTQPKNLLLLVGKNDLPFALTNSMRMYQLGCGLTPTNTSTAYAHSAECGFPDPGQANGRRVMVLDGLNHITILTASSTFQELLAWLHRAAPQQVSTEHMQFNTRLNWLLLAVAGALLAMFPLCSLAVDLFGIDGTPRVYRGLDVLFFDLCLLVGIAVAIAIHYVWRPFAFVHVLLADYVSGYFFITALVTAVLIFLVRRRIPLPTLRHALRQLVVGILLAGFLYFTIGQISTFAWQRFTLNGLRFWRFVILFVLVLPIFLLDEGISRGYQERGLWRAMLASLAFKGLLVAGLVASIAIIPGLGFLSIVLSILVLLFVLLVLFCTQLYLSGRAALAAAVLSALLIAWSMASSFPIT
jgi:pimeloyl-ACP methyl ester carboxylesterase